MYYIMKWTPEGLVCLGADSSAVHATALKIRVGGFIVWRKS